MERIKEIWCSYTRRERKNVAFYISGLMFYKLSFEIWTGSLTTIALARFNKNGDNEEVDENRPVGMLASMQTLNLVFQCFGTLLVAVALRWRKNSKETLIAMVLSGVGLSAAMLGMDLGTGGRWSVVEKKEMEEGGENEIWRERYGTWDPMWLILFFVLAGVVAGGVEVVRKVVPADILGDMLGNKLRRMDAVVHIFYELAGTAGSFLSAFLSLQLGNNFAVVVVPGLWLIACGLWMGLDVEREEEEEKKNEEGQKSSCIPGLKWFFSYLGMTMVQGSKLILSTPQFAWLPFGYSLSLYAHRYLENGLAPAIARYVYNEPAHYQIIVGGSNFGELLGALAVFMLTEHIQSPLPWVRLDAAMLFIIWAVVTWKPPLDTTGKVPVSFAWKLAGIFLPISLGWAAGDVSLLAHIQSTLSIHEEKEMGRTSRERRRKPTQGHHITSLGTVMAVLYSVYIVLFAVLNPILAKYIDEQVYKPDHDPLRITDKRNRFFRALENVAGWQYTLIAVLVGASTTLPLLDKWPWRKDDKDKEAVSHVPLQAVNCAVDGNRTPAAPNGNAGAP
ncbi:major facilitator superfamily domain-containing protein [Kalaharituber pfeilii]|nr:major facilitator superfamily domain-containing protein [Kalaharituber pfeilii]